MPSENALRYHEEIAALGLEIQCPCKDSTEVDRRAFRFMEEPLEAERNWLPQIEIAIKENKPIKTYLEGTPKRACDSYGLSMYIDAELAKRSYLSMQFSRRLPKRYTCIAACDLKKTDGLAAPVEDERTDGHFNFHPYMHTSFTGRYEKVFPV